MLTTVSTKATVAALASLGWSGRVPGLDLRQAIETVRSDVDEYVSITRKGIGSAAPAIPGLIDALMALHEDITLSDAPSFATSGDTTTLTFTIQFPWGQPDPSELQLVIRPTPYESGEGNGEVAWTAVCERVFRVANPGDPVERAATAALTGFLDAHQRRVNRELRLLRLVGLSAPQIIIDHENRLIEEATRAIVS